MNIKTMSFNDMCKNLQLIKPTLPKHNEAVGYAVVKYINNYDDPLPPKNRIFAISTKSDAFNPNKKGMSYRCKVIFTVPLTQKYGEWCPITYLFQTEPTVCFMTENGEEIDKATMEAFLDTLPIRTYNVNFTITGTRTETVELCMQDRNEAVKLATNIAHEAVKTANFPDMHNPIAIQNNIVELPKNEIHQNGYISPSHRQVPKFVTTQQVTDKYCTTVCGCTFSECPLTMDHDGCEACTAVQAIQKALIYESDLFET